MNTNQQQSYNYASALKAPRSLTIQIHVDRADQLGLPSLARQHDYGSLATKHKQQITNIDWAPAD
jgi:hypothetical protein